jgi:VanZ family protein
MSRILRFFYFYLPPVFYAGLIFYLSSIPDLTLPEWGLDFEDKLIHFLAYFGLGLLAARAFHASNGGPLSRKDLILTVVVVTLYGATDEIHQIFVPGRYADVLDWVSDFLGAVAGTYFYTKLYVVEARILASTRGRIRRNG